MKRLTLADIPKGDDEGEYTLEFRKSMLMAKKEFQKGKGIPMKKAKKMLGL